MLTLLSGAAEDRRTRHACIEPLSGARGGVDLLDDVHSILLCRANELGHWQLCFLPAHFVSHWLGAFHVFGSLAVVVRLVAHWPTDTFVPLMADSIINVFAVTAI